METKFCPNHTGCQIIMIEGFVPDPKIKEVYMNSFCDVGEENWSKCKRYLTKKALNLCPDFVMPDSTFTTDEILDKLEEE